MSKALEIQQLEAEYMKKEIPSFEVGDTVAVTTKIIEGGKERLQTFTGTVVAKKGYGLSETFTIYRTAYGSSMDRVFLLHSPRIVKVEVLRSGKVRRAKLYYLSAKSGKEARLQERYRRDTVSAAPIEVAAPEAEEKSSPETPETNA